MSVRSQKSGRSQMSERSEMSQMSERSEIYGKEMSEMSEMYVKHRLLAPRMFAREQARKDFGKNSCPTRWTESKLRLGACVCVCKREIQTVRDRQTEGSRGVRSGSVTGYVCVCTCVCPCWCAGMRKQFVQE